MVTVWDFLFELFDLTHGVSPDEMDQKLSQLSDQDLNLFACFFEASGDYCLDQRDQEIFGQLRQTLFQSLPFTDAVRLLVDFRSTYYQVLTERYLTLEQLLDQQCQRRLDALWRLEVRQRWVQRLQLLINDFVQSVSRLTVYVSTFGEAMMVLRALLPIHRGRPDLSQIAIRIGRPPSWSWPLPLGTSIVLVAE